MSDVNDTLGSVGRAEMLGRTLDARIRNIRTATPGVINRYLEGDQVADVELPVRPGGEAQPVLASRPVLIMGGGDGYLVFPYSAGDTGLVVVCDTDIGAWRASGDVGPPADDGRHGLGGGVFIPGLRVAGEEVAAPAGATVLAGGDVRLGDSAATKLAMNDDIVGAINTWAAAVSVAITALGGDVTVATGQLAIDLAASKSKIKVDS
uniref:Phage protein Gp138 N-terminal domain-containing protein n=1 Tax=viral metagenome TaxID=1070528 RepID=A0A6M3JXG5_9ZZZZ